MTWMQTQSGQSFDLVAPSPGDVRLGDILQHLCRIPRFNGATHREPWTVGQHTLLCHDLLAPSASPALRMAVLMHDMHEAYIGDITRPVEMALRALGSGDALGQLKARVQAAIAAAFGGPVQNVLGVKEVDNLALATEKSVFMAPSPDWPGMPSPSPDDRRAAFGVPTAGDIVRTELHLRLHRLCRELRLRPLPSLGL